jgi:hypothetical protein
MDNKNPLDFPYGTLDDKEAVVRLVCISRDGDGSITGKLEEFCLDSPDRPSFMTLSYVCKNPCLFSLKSASSSSPHIFLVSLSSPIYFLSVLRRVNIYYLLF